MREPRPQTLITGATGGIGAATALLLAQQGHDVWITGRQSERLTQLADRCRHHGVTVNTTLLDVTDESAVNQLFRHLQRDWKRLDHLVYCAGHLLDQSLLTTRLTDLQSLYAVHLQAALQCAQLASKLMLRARSGNLVLLSSRVAATGSAGQSAYAAMKAGVEGLTRSLSRELGPLGIRVNAVAPGLIATPMTEHYTEATRNALCQRISLQRLGTAEDVAGVIGFLCSSAADYVAGQTITVDGDFHP